jgi:predicted nucleic acid-binding protein
MTPTTIKQHGSWERRVILVDSCVLSLAFRRKRAHLNSTDISFCELLESAINNRQVEILGVVRLETLIGIREKSQYERVKKALRAFQDVFLTVGDYEDAAQMSNKCRSEGVVGSPTDFLICAVAIRRDWQILTTDRDFDLYHKYLPLELLVPNIRRAPLPN